MYVLVQCWFMKVLRKTLPTSVSNLIKRPSVHIQIFTITTLKAITRVSNKDLYLIAHLKLVTVSGRYFIIYFFHLIIYSSSLITPIKMIKLSIKSRLKDSEMFQN